MPENNIKPTAVKKQRKAKAKRYPPS